MLLYPTRQITLWSFLLALSACDSPRSKEGSTAIGPADVSASPIRHRLTSEHLERITRLHAVFAEVDRSRLEKWIEDFRRDRDPEREIRIYEGMAEAFTAYCSGRSLTLEAKHDVYQVVLLRSGAADADVLTRLRLKVLSTDDAKAILALYKTPPAPVLVAPGPSDP